MSQTLFSDSSSQQVLTVEQLTLQIKQRLETQFPEVWVAGEISNLTRPQSGHCYLTLKDEVAQVRGVLWRNTAKRLSFDLQDGLEVICRGRIDVYPPRGSYQLVVEEILPKGIGPLEVALRKLRDKLSREGLFDKERKRTLPSFPRRIGVVTSPTGAAIHDFLEVARRRWNGVRVLVIPVRVQGQGASLEIARGIGLANQILPPLDVLVVGRGGGSLEDLWAFNEEATVRAIAGSRVPVVSAVGHEIDVTLADLAADVRALTPSEAAERVVPSADEVRETLQLRSARLRTAVQRQLEFARAGVQRLASRSVLRRPLDPIRVWERQLDELSGRIRRSVDHRRQRLQSILAACEGKLEALSPRNVLERGYSITLREADGRLVRDPDQVEPGELLRTQLAGGQLTSRLEQVRRETSPNS